MSDRVLVVIDDLFELSTMSAALKLHGTNVVGEAQKATVAFSLQRSLRPNVALIDLHVIKQDSIAVAISIRKVNPEIGIVILVTCTDFRLLGQFRSEIPAGSKIVIKKSMSSVASLCEVISDSRIQNIESKVNWINGNLILDDRALASLMSRLTNIQIETLRLVADGLTNAEIGRVRYVSEKAIEQVLSRISLLLNIQPDQKKNMRVQLVGEYFKWIGAPQH